MECFTPNSHLNHLTMQRCLKMGWDSPSNAFWEHTMVCGWAEVCQTQKRQRLAKKELKIKKVHCPTSSSVPLSTGCLIWHL